jgi:hypothetical protein
VCVCECVCVCVHTHWHDKHTDNGQHRETVMISFNKMYLSSAVRHMSSHPLQQDIFIISSEREHPVPSARYIYHQR